MSSIFSSEVFTRRSKNIEKLSPNRAQLFVRNKCTVFTMGGTVPLDSPIPNYFDRRINILKIVKISEKKSNNLDSLVIFNYWSNCQ